jgi:hypothetical protein
MPASGTEHRICRGCNRRLPVNQFRRVRKDSVKRRARCRDCRRIEDQAKRDGADRRTIAAALAEVRRRQSVNAILGVVQETAAKFGGLNAFAKRWGELLLADGTSPKWKIKGCQTLVELASVAECARYACQPLEPRLRSLPRAERVALVRGMLDSGSVTIAEIDPAPDW